MAHPFTTTPPFMDLDVRPILQGGEDPFVRIMETVASLAPDQGLRLRAPFEPVPLFHVLGAQGFTHEARELAAGDWEVLFRRTGSADDVAPPAPAGAGGTDWPEPVQYLDSRDLDPPEPMVRILAALEALAPGQVLASLLAREPLFLFPELAKRGHAWRGGFLPDGDAYEILVRVGGPPGDAAADVEDPLAAKVKDALRSVIDPELGYNIVDLGLVYDITVGDGGAVSITMTTTTAGCPATGYLVDGAHDRAAAVDGAGSIEVHLTYEPAWSYELMSDRAKASFGIGPANDQ